MPPPPDSSTAAAAHRPRGLPARRSRVRGMSVRRCPAAGTHRLAAFRELRSSASGVRGLRPRRGPGVGSLHADFRSRESLPEDPWKFSTRGAGSRLSPGEARSPSRRQRGDPCREGEESEQSGARRRLPGTPACNSVAGAFLGLGDCRLSASHAVPAGNVWASTREVGTSGGAGFWPSRELCPLSCSKKPNQKANLQASKPNVTLSAGRERAQQNDKSRVFIFARGWGEFSESFPISSGEVEPAPR